MMKNGLTTVQKRLILIFGGLLIMLGVIVFVFQKNMKQANRLENDTNEKINEVNYLSDLQIRVNEMNAAQAKTQKEIQQKSQTYPCKMTQQKAISNIYKMSVASGVRLRAIRPQADKTFFKDGKFIVTTGTGDDAEQSTESEETTLSDVEKNPEKKWTDSYIYKDGLDSLVCRYMTPGIYDTETLSGFSYVEGKIIQGLHNYRMNLACQRLPASGFVGGGLKDLTIYDMRNTLEKEKWESAKMLWTDIYAKNGIIHVLLPQHEFGFGRFIQYFRNVGHEK